jgi:hypothetical protein
MTLSIMTLSIKGQFTTLSIMKLSIHDTQHIMTLNIDDTQHNNTTIMLNGIMPNVVILNVVAPILTLSALNTFPNLHYF